MLEDIEVRVHALVVLERIDVGHEVAAHPVGVDDLLNPDRLVEVGLVARRDVARPADRLVRDTERPEDLAVEVVVAEKEPVHASEEFAGLRALDDAVVVRRREGEDLGDGIARDGLGGCALPLGRVVHRPDTDDAALAVHEPGHRVVRADGAGIGEGDGRIRVVLDGELAGPCLANEIVVARPEDGEVHRLSALDIRDEQLPGAIGLCKIDRQAEVHVGIEGDRGLSID